MSRRGREEPQRSVPRPFLMVSMERLRRRAAVTAVICLGLAPSGCGGLTQAGSSAAADCNSQIRSGGVVFSSYGSTDRSGSEHGTALEAVCEDVGKDARGSVFTDDSQLVTTYRVAGYPATQVLGIERGQLDGYEVFVAESVSSGDRDRILRELDERTQ